MSIAVIAEQLTPSQRMVFRQTPDAGFFADFKRAYADYAAAAAEVAGDGADAAKAGEAEQLLNGLLGQVHMELGARRGTSAADEANYAAILDRAYSAGGMTEPARFLQSLSPQELGVVQRIHGLAEPIDAASVSREGAYNLLLPEGYSADFNGDDVIEVGAARTLRFPPADAPAAFLDAWAGATRGMGEMDIATYGLVMFTSMHTLGIDDAPIQRTAAADRVDSYRAVVDNYLAMLDRLRGSLAPGQYERDQAFFSRLQALLGRAA
jgi:hypothetical protein